jgi:hypothetical protein
MFEWFKKLLAESKGKPFSLSGRMFINFIEGLQQNNFEVEELFITVNNMPIVGWPIEFKIYESDTVAILRGEVWKEEEFIGDVRILAEDFYLRHSY